MEQEEYLIYICLLQVIWPVSIEARITSGGGTFQKKSTVAVDIFRYVIYAKILSVLQVRLGPITVIICCS